MIAKPVLLTVDDDAEVLSAIGRDLRGRYHEEYRVVRASSGAEALQATRELKQRGAAVALFLVDERMPAMSGTEFLVKALEMYPEARRVLITAYADTETAIAAINRTGIDHYLLKPWDPPEERLFPVLDRVLEEWRASAKPVFDGVRVAGTALSATSYEVRNFLSSNQVPYHWIELESDVATRALVESIEPGLSRLPVVFLPDGSALVQPTARELAERIGLQTRAHQKFYDLVIAGGGPAGLAAAVYAASEGLRTLLVERSAPGGQAGTSSFIENYLGFPEGVTGTELARRATLQACRFGAEMLTAQEVAGIGRNDPYRVVKLSDATEVSCYSVLLASGMEVRRLDVPGLEPLVGAGIFYGSALSEANRYRGRDVVVVGGANSAGQGALFFSRYARSVTLLLRARALGAGMSQYLVDRIGETANIIVRPNSVVTAVRGSESLEAVAIQDSVTGAQAELSAAAMFIFIGTAPRTEMVANLVERDAQGFILTGRDLGSNGGRPRGWTADRDPFPFETSVPGVFAAGDSRHGSGKRVAAAVGEGSATVSMIHQYLQTV
jgi:thioredoxin reductase (NADPH)